MSDLGNALQSFALTIAVILGAWSIGLVEAAIDRNTAAIEACQ